MSIHFKFRSSVNFDSVQIDGQSSISVRDLRSKVVRHKNLNITQDFDLVFSDALTGHEFKDDNYQIPSGSSVIVKRVPAGTVPSTMVQINFDDKFGIKESKPANIIGYVPVLAEDNLDDFGADLCPPPEAGISDSDFKADKHNCFSNEKPNNVAPRVGCQKLEASDLSEASPRGADHQATERNFQMQLEMNGEEGMKLEKVGGAHCPALQNADLPSELKCSLCNTYFKEAVMIPCCQHSFCEKCIRAVLIEKARCPKCYSTKCKVGDLLPNLSLRQAIEHFLESQILLSEGDKALDKDAPDGESGIQAKDFSCAVTIRQRELKMPLSPSATERGSNQIVGESVFESRIRNNVSGSRTCNLGASKALNSAPSSHKLRHIYGERVGSAQSTDLQAVPDFQGENQPHDIRQRRMHEEVDSTINKKRGFLNEGGDRTFMATGRHNKGDRTCYMCGSPDHFIRDCPLASNPTPMLSTGNAMFPGAMPGYGSPFWNGIPVAPIRPFTNMYGNFGMIPFNPAVVPASPYAVPPYMPAMYGGHPVPSGFMRTGDMSCFAAQDRTGPKRPLNFSETLELRNCVNRRMISNETLRSGGSYDDDVHKSLYCTEPERSCKYKGHVEREKSASYSEDSFTRRSPKKRRHEHFDHDSYAINDRDRSYHRPLKGRSNSEVEDKSYNSDRHSEDRHIHHFRSSKNHEKKQCGSDSSRSHHQTKIEKHVGRKRESDIEPSSSVDHKKQYKDEDRNHRSGKPISDDFRNDRWQMASGSDEDHGEGYHYNKRKRIH